MEPQDIDLSSLEMKTTNSCFLLMAAIGLSATAFAAEPAPSKPRIGVYDSRAVAVAFAGSDAHKAWMKPLITEHEKAKAAGDTKRMKELEAEGKARQKRAHTQAFATAPVDDILDHVKDQLPEIRSRAGVSVLVSKWDKKQLAKHKSAERVDVTLALVDAFKPNEKQRKSAIDIQRHKPISIRKAEQIDD